MICTMCGANAAIERVRTRDVVFKGVGLRLDDDHYTHCEHCGVDYYSPQQSKTSDRRLIDVRRRHERLMTGEEIRSLRQSFQLSQQQFEAILGIGAKTVVRWENDTAVQGKAMDNLLKMLKVDPLTIRLLQRLQKAPIDVSVKETPEFQRQSSELEQVVFARIEEVGAVEQGRVRDVTRAVMSAFFDFKEDQIEQILNEKVAVPA
jgi:HTH-type transcriptional regulator/antitoxin MqsA